MFRRSKAELIVVFLIVPLFAFADPALPVIPNQTFVVTDYGAVGDGVSTNTTVIQDAINAASTAGGGTVEIPSGTFLCGPLTMKSSINLQLDSGALLRMLPYDQYPGGIVSPANFINGSSLHDVEISGTGVIDGQGSPWWPGYKTNNRPVMVNFTACTRVWIRDATFSNSPAAHLVVKRRAGNLFEFHLSRSENILKSSLCLGNEVATLREKPISRVPGHNRPDDERRSEGKRTSRK
jgi:polygalacturonase